VSETDNQKHHSILRSIAHRVMHEKGLWPDFHADEIAEVEAITQHELRVNNATRDLRKLCWCSIDHNDTQSLDQLTYAESLSDGKVKILVAIADVETMVKVSSAVDKHARHNTCSVYTAVELFPMLPNKLCANLSSLSHGEDRLALIVEMLIAKDGALTGTSFYPAWVNNKAKLHYQSLSNWLEGCDTMPQAISDVRGLEANLRLQDKVARLMNEQRHEHGAMDYETQQARPVFENEDIKDLAAERPNRARDIVTDFMIAANGVVATYLGSKNFPSFRRVVKFPKRWDRIFELAAEHGYKLPVEPDAKALNQFLRTVKAADPNGFAELSYSVMKLLGPGEFTIELPGNSSGEHFGLAVKDYTHSTAPNRRYPDLITQRLLKAAIAGQPIPYQIKDLEELAGHCTQVEDVVKKVERQVAKSVSAMHLQSRIGDSFDGIITGASEKGTWVRTQHPPVEGRLVNGFEGMDVGHKLRVQLVRADVQRGFIDFKRI